MTRSAWGATWIVLSGAIACGGTTVGGTGATDRGGSHGGSATTGDAGNEGGFRGGAGGVPAEAGVRAGSGGSSSGGGGAGPAASLGTVHIEFYGGPRNFCVGTCSPKIEIFDEARTQIHPAGECFASQCPMCGYATCDVDPCNGFALPFSYLDLTWDGAYDELVDCQDGTSCASRHFAAAGTYAARLCLAPGTLVADGPAACVATGPVECTTIHFEYPAGGSVHANMGCAALDEKCAVTADCCQTDAYCIGGFCAITL